MNPSGISPPSSPSPHSPPHPSLLAQIQAGIIFSAAVMRRRISLRRQAFSAPVTPTEARDHSYLGEGQLAPSLSTHDPLPHDSILPLITDLESSGRILLPILILHDVVLFPHQTLPLRLSPFDPANSYLRNAIEDSADGSPILIGILNADVEPASSMEERVGTIAEISKVMNSTSDDSEEGGQAMTLTGLRRFLLNPTNILPSSSAYENPSDHRMIGYRSRTPSCTWAVVTLTLESLPPLPDSISTLSSRSGIPAFLLHANEVRSLIARIRAACTNDADSPPSSPSSSSSSSSPKKQKVSSPTQASPPPFASILPEIPPPSCDPLFFSFFLCDNLPLSNPQRYELLTYPTAQQRLRKCIELMGLKKKRSEEKEKTDTGRGGNCGAFLQCSSCGTTIGRQTDVFSVPGAAGSNNAYVNPHGAVHQTITLRKVTRDVVLEASLPTLQDTWFPGYAWTILYCRCRGHLGWKFTLIRGTADSVALERSPNGAVVKEFFGVRASALNPNKNAR
mmetsp:Transcript_10124/g.20712  ORF Transcript_10124/g.20712 Transcript_10124/m.20712 type:complete len:508 (+) Transcript_10124:241-1764(+)|eukprot:CAMPEP_0118637620 /NCGR_PEP_ID=MMETSP0785-20121206/3247_1 /TAXON_ID=91992 /ORGANISM="Bolidomonas pacifica, Strain CCMP 1866" /LENGTH=507 /DNA_ID=CAMNT_0006528813 /DNA_START=193 /DNA_END=1716 /DNA_ORIENTATION=-